MRIDDGTKMLDSAVISERSNERSTVHKAKRRANKTFDGNSKVEMGDKSKPGMNLTDREN